MSVFSRGGPSRVFEGTTAAAASGSSFVPHSSCLHPREETSRESRSIFLANKRSNVYYAVENLNLIMLDSPRTWPLTLAFIRFIFQCLMAEMICCRENELSCTYIISVKSNFNTMRRGEAGDLHIAFSAGPSARA